MTRTGADGPFTVNLGGFPLVRFASPDIVGCDRVDVPSYFACLDRTLARNVPCVILHDVRGNPPVSDQDRKDFQKFLEPRRAPCEQLVIAYAAVCGSPVERAIITAFTWFIKLSLPIRIFASEAEAQAWLMSRYEAHRKGLRGNLQAPATAE